MVRRLQADPAPLTPVKLTVLRLATGCVQNRGAWAETVAFPFSARVVIMLFSDSLSDLLAPRAEEHDQSQPQIAIAFDHLSSDQKSSKAVWFANWLGRARDVRW